MYLQALIHPFETIRRIIDSGVDRTKDLLQQDFFEKKTTELTYQALHSKESGISKEQLCNKAIVVSLTSYGKRIHDVYLAIESIMQGSLKPNHIVLWLSEDEFKGKALPITIQNQMHRGLEVRYCKDIRSYKKIIYALKEYPDACIITVDDDLVYNFDLVENLVHAYNSNQKCIWANRIHEMRFDNNGKIKSYLQWSMCSKNNARNKENNFFTSGGGALFPPYSLHNEVFNEEVFLNICPTADDIWLNAMARLKGTEINKSFTHSPTGEDFLVNMAVQSERLDTINNNPKDCKNDIQFKAVFEKYNILKFK